MKLGKTFKSMDLIPWTFSWVHVLAHAYSLAYAHVELRTTFIWGVYNLPLSCTPTAHCSHCKIPKGGPHFGLGKCFIWIRSESNPWTIRWDDCFAAGHQHSLHSSCQGSFLCSSMIKSRTSQQVGASSHFTVILLERNSILNPPNVT